MAAGFGKVYQLGYLQAARCSDCHGAHNIYKMDNPKSTISPRNIVKTCQKCHEDANMKFTGYLSHATHYNKDKFPWITRDMLNNYRRQAVKKLKLPPIEVGCNEATQVSDLTINLMDENPMLISASQGVAYIEQDAVSSSSSPNGSPWMK